MRVQSKTFAIEHVSSCLVTSSLALKLEAKQFTNELLMNWYQTQGYWLFFTNCHIL